MTVESTFERHLDRLDLARLVDDGVVTRDELVATIRGIDSLVAAVDGHGFAPTPFGPQPALAAAAGLPDGVDLWVKDETGNVSGSHKARHLFGVAVREAIAPSGDGPWAIASCGNAALGASVVAAAAGHQLDVYVPTWASDDIVDRMAGLGASVHRVDREPGVLGDPAHHAMVASIAGGSVAFSCQGTETPAAIDGGRTLAYEMVESLVAHDHPNPPRLDRLFIQVGGGALGTAVVTGLTRSEIAQLPIVHAVQPVGNHPLVRAWDTVAAELLGTEPTPTVAGRLAAAADLGRLDDAAAREVGHRLRADPDRYMQPWPDEPVSYATGILDDLTYDWLALVDAMLRTGGAPIVAAETDFRVAHRLAHEHTAIPVCPTGAAGFGGLLALVAASPDTITARERIGVLFTGHQRSGDPSPT